MQIYDLYISGVYERSLRRKTRPSHIPHKNVEWYPRGTDVTTDDPANVGFAVVGDESIQTVLNSATQLYPTIEDAKQAMTAWIEFTGFALRGFASTDERDSWTAKRDEARAYLADPTTPTPVMDAEISITGETRNELATRIDAKATEFANIAGLIAGLRRNTEAALDQTTTSLERVAVLDAARAQAEALIAGL